MTHFVKTTNNMSFSDYILNCRELIANRRLFSADNPNKNKIIDYNTPFEYTPEKPICGKKKYKFGVLMSHGLLDSPFTMRDLGKSLQDAGMLCRSILLPGHGTQPVDLTEVTYQDWLDTMAFGIERMKEEADHIFIVGYSTGAALAIHHTLQRDDIAGIILVSPAIRLKMPIEIAVDIKDMTTWLGSHEKWILYEDENDYVKYRSIAINGVKQVRELCTKNREIFEKQQLSCPMAMVISSDDETISASSATKFFLSQKNPINELLLYTVKEKPECDERTTIRNAQYPKLHIEHMSHQAIPFTADNVHYGQRGDYIFASRTNQHEYTYGSYNAIKTQAWEMLYDFKLSKDKKKPLTYNPDFDYYAAFVKNFILKVC